MYSRGMIDIVFIGTSSAIPAFNRWLPSILVKVDNEYLLLDCGEGTQYRIIKAGLKVNRLTAVFITHLHGDHFYGLPGLLESLGVLGREKPLKVYGPRGLKGFLEASLHAKALEYPLEIIEVAPGELLVRDSYKVLAFPAIHGVEAYSYKIVCNSIPGKFNENKARELGIPPSPLRKRLLRGEPVRLSSGRIVYPSEVVGPPRTGLSIVYSGDTVPNRILVEQSKDVDVLIHEATFTEKHAEEAEVSKHSTARGAALAAEAAQVKLLILFHYSGRYRSQEPFLEEARPVFRRTYASLDMLKVSLKRVNVNDLRATFTILPTREEY